MNSAESKYIDKKSYRSRYAPERVSNQAQDHAEKESAVREEGVQWPKDDLAKFIPFLRRECGLEFFGRILKVRSELYLYPMVARQWMVKYRVTYPDGLDGESQVNAFMQALPWTIRDLK